MRIRLSICLLLAGIMGCSKPPEPAQSPYAAASVPAGVPATAAKNMKNMPPELRARLQNQVGGAR